MVYKLYDYSYSFIRRMRELASPLEAYNLQTADIDCKLQLKPWLAVVQFSNQNPCYFFDFAANNAYSKPQLYEDWGWQYSDSPHIPKVNISLTLNDSIMHFAQKLVLQKYSTFQPFFHTVFKSFAFNVQVLVIKNSYLDKEFFVALNRYIQIENLDIKTVSCEIDSKVTFKDLFDLCDMESDSLCITCIWRDQWLPKLLDSYADVPSVLILKNASLYTVTEEDLANFFCKVSQVKKSFELRLCGLTAQCPREYTKHFFKITKTSKSPYRLILEGSHEDYCLDFNLDRKLKVKRLVEKFNSIDVRSDQRHGLEMKPVCQLVSR